MPLADIQYLSFSPVGGYPLFAGIALALLAILWLAPRRGAFSTRHGKVLYAIRLVTFLLLLLELLRPTIVYSTISRQDATVLVLIDRSRSLQVADGEGQKSRWATIQDALEQSSADFQKLAEKLRVKFYLFDERPTLVDAPRGIPDLSATPDGSQTCIGSTLEDVLELERGQRIDGLILFSDGAQRAHPPRNQSPQLPARAMARDGQRIFSVTVGQAQSGGQLRNAGLSDLATNDPIFEKNVLDVTAVAQIHGYVNQPLTVQLLFESPSGEMEVIAARQIQGVRDGERIPIAFEHTPQSSGEFKLSVRIETQAGEVITSDNEQSTIVTVRGGGLSVLYLSGALGSEQKFLRQSLDSAEEMHVDFRYFRADKPQTKPGNLAALLEPGKYDVYILGDLDSRAFTQEELTSLTTSVERGAGLIMIGGIHSFGPGGYFSSPLGAALPIVMDRFETQNFDEPIRTDLHHVGRIKMQPTNIGNTQSLMQLAPGPQNDAAWKQLPPLDGANKFAGVKPGANVLAQGERNQPLLVAKDFNAGRVLCFAGDSTWRWVMYGQDVLHRRFWRQVVLWLARKEDTSSGSVWVRLDQRRFGPNSRVEFKAGAKTSEGLPDPEATFTAEVIASTGKPIPVPLATQGDSVRGTAMDLQAGDYTLVVRGTRQNTVIGEARARFIIHEQDIEWENPVADRGLLESLSTITGGKSVLPGQLPDLIKELEAESKKLEVETQVKRTLWDQWPPFFLIVGALCLEWFLRRKWGLV